MNYSGAGTSNVASSSAATSKKAKNAQQQQQLADLVVGLTLRMFYLSDTFLLVSNDQ